MAPPALLSTTLFAAVFLTLVMVTFAALVPDLFTDFNGGFFVIAILWMSVHIKLLFDVVQILMNHIYEQSLTILNLFRAAIRNLVLLCDALMILAPTKSSGMMWNNHWTRSVLFFLSLIWLIQNNESSNYYSGFLLPPGPVSSRRYLRSSTQYNSTTVSLPSAGVCFLPCDMSSLQQPDDHHALVSPTPIISVLHMSWNNISIIAVQPSSQLLSTNETMWLSGSVHAVVPVFSLERMSATKSTPPWIWRCLFHFGVSLLAAWYWSVLEDQNSQCPAAPDPPATSKRSACMPEFMMSPSSISLSNIDSINTSQGMEQLQHYHLCQFVCLEEDLSHLVDEDEIWEMGEIQLHLLVLNPRRKYTHK